ncbi:MAG TPA: TadE/TadG family type IV pilus assembly protein [Abditibacteriaceae bacterium]|jgi:Flp pilus assembly protein TadG
MHSIKRRRSGQSLVEFALVVPILIALMVGIMEFGWLAKNTLQLSNAVREGARTASMGGTTTAIAQKVQQRAVGITVSVTCTFSKDNSTYTPLGDNAGFNTAPEGALIRVTALGTHRSLTGLIPVLRQRKIVVNAEFGRE